MRTKLNVVTNLFYMLLALILAIPMMLFYGLTSKKQDDVERMVKATAGKYYRVASSQEGEA